MRDRAQALLFALVGCSSPRPEVGRPPTLVATVQMKPVADEGRPKSAVSKLRCPEDMLLIPAGSFTMGPAAHAGESETDPAHSVKLSAYCLDRTEVTLGAYRRCEDAGGCTPAPTTVQWSGASAVQIKLWSTWCTAGLPDHDRHPINCVGWYQADAYCKWASQRLPTEAEWERAARGVNGRKHPWGEQAIGPTKANVCGSECQRLAASVGEQWAGMHNQDDGWEATAPVGSFPDGNTPDGISDLAGNVWEWVHDLQAPYLPRAVVDPRGPSSSSVDSHIMRGGGWYTDDVLSIRGATRNAQLATDRYSHLGFRCAADPREP